MKRFLVVIFSILLFICGSEGFAQSTAKSPAQKFTRGFTHMVMSPFHVPKQIIETASESDPVWMGAWKGVTLGTGQGLFNSGRQAVSGLYDVFTFWTPAGTDWQPLFETESLFPQI